MRAFVYAGGPVTPERIEERPDDTDLTIAADAGWKNAKKTGVTPKILVGDFDSLGEPQVPDGTELYRVPTEKNDTDLQLAVKIAIARGATEIVIVAGLGGRIDHTLSALAVAEDLHGRKIRAVIVDGKNRLTYLANDSMLIVKDKNFQYLSIIAVSEKLRGVTIEGCKYPLKNATIERRNQFAVSNEITGNAALITVRRGAAYIIESSD